MKKVSHKLIAVLLAAALLLLFFFLFFDTFQEAWLVRKYLSDPEKKAFALQIQKDKEDVSKRPKDTSVLMDLGFQWYNLQEFKLAAKWWQKGLKRNPKNTLGWTNLGNAYLNLKDYPKAEKAYREGIKTARQGEVDACLALGDLYHYAYTKSRHKEDDVYIQCLKQHKGNRDLIAHLAIYYRDTGNITKALRWFDRLFSIEPTPDVSEEIRNLRIKQEEQKKNN